MCRIRFHRDGIYLSFLYIQRVKEPYYPSERVYQEGSDSSLPYAIIGERAKKKKPHEVHTRQEKVANGCHPKWIKAEKLDRKRKTSRAKLWRPIQMVEE